MTHKDPMIGRVLRQTIEIRRKLGQGGMGAVYEAWQSNLERKLAVKILSQEHAQNPLAAEYFLREARSASRLRHPNVIQIIDFGNEDDTLFLAMEYIPGRSLAEILEGEEELPAERITAILKQVLSALGAAHAEHVVHRDIKPDNIMVETLSDGSDLVKVLDFGIAQIKASDSVAGPLTMQGAVVGTPAYMSPEQVSGGGTDHRSDLWSVGMVLYELLTGTTAFKRDKPTTTMLAVLKDDLVSPSVGAPKRKIDPALEAVCLRALQKPIEARYQSAAEFSSALDGDIASAAISNTAPSSAAILKVKRRVAEDAIVDTVIQSQTQGAGLIEESSVAAAGDEIKPQIPMPVVDLTAHGSRFKASILVVQHRMRARLEVDELPEAMQRIDSAIEATADAFGGELALKQGGLRVLLFPYQSAEATAETQAAMAALRLREILPERTESFSFGFALDHGEIWLAAEGFESAVSTAIDEAITLVNRAADLEIVVENSALQERLQANYRLRANGELFVVEETLAEPVAYKRGTDLFGRDLQIAAIFEDFARLRQQEGGTVVWLGGPGVGKTALMDHAAALAHQRDWIVLRARHRFAGALGVDDLYRQVLQGLLRHDGVAPEELAAYLAGLDAPGWLTSCLVPWTRAARSSVFSADQERLLSVGAGLRSVIEARSADRPIVIIADPYESFDSSFIQQWSAFSTTTDHHPVLLYLTARRNAHDREHTWIHRWLEALDRDAVARWIASAGHDADPDEVYKETAGICALVASRLALGHHNADDTLEARLMALPPNVRNVLALIAILGEFATMEAIEALSRPTWNAGESIETLANEGLLHVLDENVEIRPSTLLQTVLRTLPGKAKVRLHEEALDWYRRRPDLVSQLATLHHLRALGQSEAAQTLARTVAEALFELGNPRGALELCEEVLHTDGLTLNTIEFTRMAARAERLLHLRTQAIQRLRTAQSHLDAHQLHALRLDLAALWLDEEDPALVLQFLAKLQDLDLEDRDEARRVFLEASALEKAGQFAKALQSLQHFVACWPKGIGEIPPWSPWVRMAAIHLRLTSLALAAEALNYAKATLAHAQDREGSIAVAVNEAALLMATDKFDLALHQLENAGEMAKEVGDLRALSRIEFNRGLLYRRQHRNVEALQHLERAHEISMVIDEREIQALASNAIGSLEVPR